MEQLNNTKIRNSSKTQNYGTAQKDQQDHYSKASDERLLGDLL